MKNSNDLIVNLLSPSKDDVSGFQSVIKIFFLQSKRPIILALSRAILS